MKQKETRKRLITPFFFVGVVQFAAVALGSYKLVFQLLKALEYLRVFKISKVKLRRATPAGLSITRFAGM